uniref:HTH psq-type domain-containing protein n=1 Tax=Cacopsylla melanoneura TaxID=428564 RepID=A0A8D8W811_9HEMI
MPRQYKKPVGRTYKKYDDAKFQAAFNGMRRGMSIREAANKFGIPYYTVLQMHKTARASNKPLQKQGGQTVLSAEENLIVEKLVICGEWGYPLDTFDLRLFVKSYLDRIGRVERRPQVHRLLNVTS